MSLLIGFAILQVVGLRASVPCWLLPEATFISLPHEPPHKVAHNIAACFIKESKQEKGIFKNNVLEMLYAYALRIQSP